MGAKVPGIPHIFFACHMNYHGSRLDREALVLCNNGNVAVF
jgi:hypothetical protein